ncbi:hypothetical protein [Croceicoccus marinus]|uniref:Uncharacterized protein n=1 Tax=Croceicoccus marinus TaxID=450378 RepID=A0A1Z1FDK3_9SPHN|nr:hypothetical protein [Croceicoccus marinus]ARU16822.1 hypothetical protein A9D14_12375 [Croceicoccus marinus]
MISQQEASSVLRDVEATQTRTVRSGLYAAASPHLLLWGAVWACGYALCQFTGAEQWPIVWGVLTATGVAAAFLLSWRQGRGHDRRDRSVGAIAIMTLTVGLFIIASLVLFAPVDPRAALAFPSLVMGLVYIMMGYSAMPRLAVVGAGIAAVVMAGFLLAPEWTALFAAAAGGGGLMLGGLWLPEV